MFDKTLINGVILTSITLNLSLAESVFAIGQQSISPVAVSINGTAALPQLRISEAVPSWSLTNHTTANAAPWQLEENLGQSSTLLLLVHSFAPQKSAATTGNSSLPSWKDEGSFLTNLVQHGLRPANVQLALVLPNSATARELSTHYGQNGAALPFSVLVDEKQQLFPKPQIGPLSQGKAIPANNSNVGTIVLIDRAGFVRHVQNVLSFDELHRTLGVMFATAEERKKVLPPALLVGAPAPDFIVTDMNGQVQRLSDRRGKKNVLLTFFPKCGSPKGDCATHLTSLQKHKASFEAAQTDILAVSIDPAQGESGQIAYAKNLSLTFPLIPDTGRNLSLLYGAVQSPNQRASRMTVLIDKNGTVRLIDKQIEIATHGWDMISKIQELKLNSPPMP